MYLDESYCHVNDNWGFTWPHIDDKNPLETATSDSKAEMIVIVGAGSKLGEVKGARKVYHVRGGKG